MWPRQKRKLRKVKAKMKKQKVYVHKGTKLEPLTPEVAMSLDSRDYVKYIGPEVVGTSYNNQTVFDTFRRRPFMLPSRPSIKGHILVISYRYGNSYKVPLKHLALVQRGDPNALKFSYAKRYIPTNLKRFKEALAYTISRAQDNIDAYLNELPLHKRMEFFKEMSPEDKKIYDCLYKDIEVLIGLKEDVPEPSDGTPGE